MNLHHHHHHLHGWTLVWIVGAVVVIGLGIIFGKILVRCLQGADRQVGNTGNAGSTNSGSTNQWTPPAIPFLEFRTVATNAAQAQSWTERMEFSDDLTTWRNVTEETNTPFDVPCRFYRMRYDPK